MDETQVPFSYSCGIRGCLPDAMVERCQESLVDSWKSYVHHYSIVQDGHIVRQYHIYVSIRQGGSKSGADVESRTTLDQRYFTMSRYHSLNGSNKLV